MLLVLLGIVFGFLLVEAAASQGGRTALRAIGTTLGVLASVAVALVAPFSYPVAALAAAALAGGVLSAARPRREVASAYSIQP
jgi:hypothetical protein